MRQDFHMFRHTVVIPTYNEADNLPLLVDALFSLNHEEIGILIVDDASPDGTGEVAEEMAHQHPGRLQVLHRQKKQGLGRAYVAGFELAIRHGAEFIIQMDADFSHSPSYLPEFLRLIQTCDLVIGSRYVAGGSIYANRATGRNLLSWWANTVCTQFILGIETRDATSGFRCWRSSALASIGLDRVRSNGYIFQVEMCYAAENLGLRIKETPIHFEKRRFGKSKMSTEIQLEAVFRILGMACKKRFMKLSKLLRTSF